MRIPGNKVRHIVDFFYSELTDIYGEAETEAMLQAAMHGILGFSRTDILRRVDENLNQSDLLKLYDCCKDLKKHIPLQYILSEAWFYHLRFYVNKNVLIPRPETEELVYMILKENPECRSLLDIGTGSGCIAVTLAKNLRGCKVSACDISGEALKVAERNAKSNHVPVHFSRKDVLRDDLTGEQYEVIVSNPPYIKKAEKDSLAKHVLEHEPHLALFVEGGDDIIFYRRIIELCRQTLLPGGKLYFELNPLTADQVKKLAEDTGIFSEVALIGDMSGNLRFLRARKM